jgi:hypothetical protein
MGLDTQDERLCSMTSINKRNDSSLVFTMLVQHSVSAESWQRRDNGMASSWGHVLRRRRTRPAANLNRRGESGTPWVGAGRTLWLTGSAHMLHGSGGWVGCVGQAARHTTQARNKLREQSRQEQLQFGDAHVWLVLGRVGDAVGIIDVLLFSYACLGYLDLHYVCVLYVCACLFESEVRGEAAAAHGAWHGAWRMACGGTHHGVADGPPPSLLIPSAHLPR